MQPGWVRTSCLGVPLLLLARRVGWLAPVRPSLGLWFVAPCPSAVLGAYARVVSGASWRMFTAARILCVLRAVSVATWRLFTGVCAVWSTRVMLVASFGSPSLLFVFFSCLVLSSFCFCFFWNSPKGGAPKPQAQEWAVGAAVQQCCVPLRGAFCWCLLGGPGPRVSSRVMMYAGAGSDGFGWVSLRLDDASVVLAGWVDVTAVGSEG